LFAAITKRIMTKGFDSRCAAHEQASSSMQFRRPILEEGSFMLQTHSEPTTPFKVIIKQAIDEAFLSRHSGLFLTEP